jgi:hypothetical protein
MRKRITTAVLVVVAGVGGCTTSGGSPATAPSTYAPVATATTTTDTSTTTTHGTATTLDRLAEITRIFEDLERRRLEAIASFDLEAFRSVYGNAAFLERSLEAYRLAVVIDVDAVQTLAIDVVVDQPTCVAATIRRDYTRALKDGGNVEYIYVIESVDGEWGLSWVGEGWLCEGSHPLQS